MTAPAWPSIVYFTTYGKVTVVSRTSTGNEMLQIHRHLCRNSRASLFTRAFASTKANDEPVVKYTDTINIPKTQFPARLKETARLDVAKRLREVKSLVLF